MTHKTKITYGTDCRDFVIRCTCGWAFSGTRMDVGRLGFEHVKEDCIYSWKDPRRKFIPDQRRNTGAAA